MPPAPPQSDWAIAIVGFILTAIALFCVPRYQIKRLPFSALIVLLLAHMLVGWSLKMYNNVASYWLIGFAIPLGLAVLPSRWVGMIGLSAFVTTGIAGAVVLSGRSYVQQARDITLVAASIAAWCWAIGGARHRMELVALPRSFILWALLLISWNGIWLGWLIATFITPYFGDWMIRLSNH